MKELRLPSGFRLERLKREHRRRDFSSGQPAVDDWLRTKALQNQDKQLSVTTVLLDSHESIAGYYTVAISQTSFDDLPPLVRKKLPRRMLPVAVLAWLGVAQEQQGAGLGQRLLGAALRDCHSAGQMFAFIAVVVDCIDDLAKAFYEKFDFEEMVGRPYQLFLSWGTLTEMMSGDEDA